MRRRRQKSSVRQWQRARELYADGWGPAAILRELEREFEIDPSETVAPPDKVKLPEELVELR